MKKHDFFSRTAEVSSRSILRRTITSFILFACFVTAVSFGWKWLYTQPKEQGALKPLRTVLAANEKIFGAVYDSNDLTKTYPANRAAKNVRANGYVGLRDIAEVNNWKLNVVKSEGDTLQLTLEDIKKLPKKDIVFDFKCIEGWSQVTHWAGVPLKTFLEHYGLNTQQKMNFIGLSTPDKGYYVGIDMASALHPQTILCYEMNGKPLPLNQGYPLRLIIPVKYGVKHLKKIGTIYFSNQKPPDYWAERGYDYYTGL
jgi:DMSO/TMAO reductase YedYZ molybdopterin-dependent catalytic subunit